MSQCANCGNQLSCGCQRRTASNGTQVCSSCLARYEASIKQSTPATSAEGPTFNEWRKNRNNNLQKFIR